MLLQPSSLAAPFFPVYFHSILVHASNLTGNGSFHEVQIQLEWLYKQSHKYEIFSARTHDVLLDEGFLAKYLERMYSHIKTTEDLN